MDTLNKLATDLYEEYLKGFNENKGQSTFSATVYLCNNGIHYSIFAKTKQDFKKFIEDNSMEIDVLSLYEKEKGEDINIYPSQYVSHEIKENKLEVKLKNKDISFDLK